MTKKTTFVCFILLKILSFQDEKSQNTQLIWEVEKKQSTTVPQREGKKTLLASTHDKKHSCLLVISFEE